MLAALLVAGPTLLHESWPDNHEGLSFFSRAEAFRRAYVAGDLLPTWTRFSFRGHGTPSPLLYHRLFNASAGALAVPFGVEAGGKLAIGLFLALGMWGLFRAARRLGADPVVAFGAALLFGAAPYVTTDWLIRGSAAELSAVMVTPWVLEALIRWAQGERAHLSLGVWLGLLFHAHQATFLFAAPLVLTAFLVRVARRGGSKGHALLDAFAALGVLLVVAGPHAWVVWKLSPFFRVQVLSIFVPWNELRPWWAYFADDTYAWGKSWHGVTVEVGRWLWVAMAFGLAAALAVGKRRALPVGALVLFAVSLGWLFFLQLPWAVPLYQAVPLLALVQFPWRLDGYLTPLVVLMAAAGWGVVSRRSLRWRAVTVVVWVGLVGLQLGFVWRAQRIDYGRVSQAVWAIDLGQLDGPWSAREFMPAQAPPEPGPVVPLVRTQGCTVVSERPALGPTEHLRQVEVELDAPNGCLVAFSQYATPLLEVTGDGEVGRLDDGTFAVQVRPGGKRVGLRVKGFWALVFGL